MAAKKKRQPALATAPCGHSACTTCGVCPPCAKTASQQIGQLMQTVGQSAAREEQLRQYIASDYQPLERDERNLSIARIAILRRRLEDALRLGVEPIVRSVIEEALRMDDLSRTRPIDEVMMEATSLGKPPPTPKAQP